MAKRPAPAPHLAFAKRHADKVRRYPTLAGLLDKSAAELARETWLFACPHDDDIAIGAGLWLKAAREANVNCHLLAATDGRMGYCNLAERRTLVRTREDELVASCRILGLTDLKNLHLLGFPDCSLTRYQGRRTAEKGDVTPEGKTGFTGLQGAFVQKLREIRPTRLILPSPQDYHPDHQIVHNEMMIAIFHAAGGVWPELGPVCHVPTVYECAIYCDFPSPPTLRLECDDAYFQSKLDAIAAYKSQTQIGALVEKVRSGGTYEYLREVNFTFYDPNVYHPLFAKK